MIPNSFIYEFTGKIVEKNIHIFENNPDFIVLKINNDFFLFKANTNDFNQEEITKVYNLEQIYININNLKVSFDFLNDYKKIKKINNYFEIDNYNLFIDSENEVKKILNNVFIGKCLDIGCGDSKYKNIFFKEKVDYLGLDIEKVDNGLNVLKTSFEDFNSKGKYDTIFFFRSINHFKDTNFIFDKAKNLLKQNGILFFVENQVFAELKFKNQIFEGKKRDYEHFHNYALNEFIDKINLENFNILYKKSVSNNTANQWYLCIQKI